MVVTYEDVKEKKIIDKNFNSPYLAEAFVKKVKRNKNIHILAIRRGY